METVALEGQNSTVVLLYCASNFRLAYIAN